MTIKPHNHSKILIISSEFPPGPGGIGNHAYNLANELSKRGNFVIVNTISDYVTNVQARAFDKKLSFGIYRFQRYSNIVLTWIQRVNTIRKTIKKYNLKRVIVSGKFSIWVIPLLKLYSGIRICTVVHGSELGKTIFLNWTIFCLNKSNTIISVSNFTRSLIPKKISPLIHVINNGVSLNNWANVPYKYDLKKYPTLITVGSITFRKGQFNVLMALPDIIRQFPHTHYHCVGNNQNKQELLSLAKNLNLTDKITIHGFLEHYELEQMYSACHINMMLADNKSTSDFEGFGISVLEANVYGLPSIGSEQTGLEDAIKNNFNGEIVDPNDSQKIVKALKQIFDNYETYSKNSKIFAKENMWENKIRQYEKIL